MKLGAFDYLIKPVEDEKLLEVLNNAMEHSALHRTIEGLPEKLSREDLTHGAAFDHFVTQDDGMIRLFHQAERIASGDLSIFIWGESGTGKEALARAIHKASLREDNPFVAAEADSQDPESFPAFFFGQARDWSGSRAETTGILEQANHGTLFLNHIDALTPPMQVRLKRVIQTGEYYKESSAEIRKADVRLIVASNKDLARPEYKDRFQRDLLYHLMINSIWIPPLRDRMGDLPILANHLLGQEAAAAGKSIAGFSDDFFEYLRGYGFPGNVQELRTIIAGAVANTEGDTITAASIPPYIKEAIDRQKVERKGEFKPKKLDEVVREYVQRTLDHFSQQKETAARELGISIEDLDRIIGTSRE
jgi:DNA-binding NtrC family response regulator